MARELKITKAYSPEMWDTETGESCVTEKVVDVTEDCPGTSQGEKCIFLFTRTKKRGRIVQMTRPYKGKKYMGRGIHFFVDELDNEMHVSPRDDTFGRWASELGLSKTELIALIKAQVPEV